MKRQAHPQKLKTHSQGAHTTAARRLRCALSTRTHIHPREAHAASRTRRLGACARPWALPSPCAPGCQAFLREGEERLRGVRDEPAGRGEGRGREGGEAGPGRRREARRRLRQRAAAARRARTGSPELGWAAVEEEPQELQLCQLGPSFRDPGLAGPCQPQVGRGWAGGRGSASWGAELNRGAVSSLGSVDGG